MEKKYYKKALHAEVTPDGKWYPHEEIKEWQ